MSNFIMLGGFLIIPIVISLQAFPAYILQFLMVRFKGKSFRFILPAISLFVMLIFGIVLSFPALRMESFVLFRIMYVLISLIVFQIPTLVLILVGNLAVKSMPEKSEVNKMRTMDLE